MERTIDGRRVFAHTGGADPDPSSGALVLIHGAGNDHSVWRYQTRLLAAAGWPVLAPDLPGHGKSDGPRLGTIGDMAEWVLRLVECSPRVIAVGYSMGSLVAMEMAARRPDLVAGVGLVATGDVMPVHPDLLQAADERLRLAADLIIGWSHTGASRFGQHPDPGVWKTAGNRRLLERHAGVLGADLRACAEWTGESVVGRLEVPALVIAGEHDRMTPVRAARALAASLSDATLVEVPGGSHASLYDHPREIRRALEAWLDRLGAFPSRTRTQVD